MTTPIDHARLQAHLALRRAGLALDCPKAPELKAIRFRPDGKGGELASPFPMAAGLDAEAVAEQCLSPGWFERIYPSGGWIAFDLSDQWRDYVRAWRPDWSPLELTVPPVPAFPGRIDPAAWRFCALVGQGDPAVAARLDLGSPYRRLERAERLAGQSAGGQRQDRLLLNLCAQCTGPEQLYALVQAYLAHPGEDDTVARLLRQGRKLLSI